MILLDTFIPGVPVAQPRTKARAVVAGGRAYARVYTPKGAVQPWKERVAVAALQARQEGCFVGTGVPVQLRLRLVFPRPKARVWKRRKMPAEWHTSKPDVDNVLKAVKDALSGVLWQDDRQVCAVTVEKVIAAGDGQVGAWLHVETLAHSPSLFF